MKQLFKMIENAQKAFHISTKYGTWEYEYQVEKITKAGNTIRYIAQRDYSERGLSYRIYKETISIAKGYKNEYIGYTHGFGMDSVVFIPTMA